MKSYRLNVLRWALLLPKFSMEFTRQGGFSWLEWAIATTDDHDAYIDLTVVGMYMAKTFLELAQWAYCLRESLSDPIRNSTDEVFDGIDQEAEDDIMYPRNPNRPSDKTDRLGMVQLILKDQTAQRWPDNTTQPEGDQHGYIREWDDWQWEEWREYMEGLIEGLKTGRILDNSPYYIRDPDGTCFNRI